MSSLRPHLVVVGDLKESTQSAVVVFLSLSVTWSLLPFSVSSVMHLEQGHGMAGVRALQQPETMRSF